MATKIGIAFRHGGIIPASVLKRDKDVSVAAHEAIEVPADYGQHLIDDKFAYAKDVEKAPKAKKDTAAGSGQGQSAGDAELTAQIAAAERSLQEANDKLAAAGDDTVAKAAAGKEIAAAKNMLKKLRG